MCPKYVIYRVYSGVVVPVFLEYVPIICNSAANISYNVAYINNKGS